jgi:phosphoribosylamine--glycine ligase
LNPIPSRLLLKQPIIIYEVKIFSCEIITVKATMVHGKNNPYLYEIDLPNSNTMKILLVGGGGREHALAWKMAQSPLLEQLYIAPGNAGTAELGTNVSIGVEDFEGMKKLVLDEGIDLVVVGPEAPLVAGIADFFKGDPELKDVPVVGPTKAGAELEGSKDFAKIFMQDNNIPTGDFRTFIDYSIYEGKDYLAKLDTALCAEGRRTGRRERGADHR